MKKHLKIILVFIFVIILSILIDLVCIFTISKPIFAIQTNKDIQVYKGLFFDTYNCLEYSIPQIKRKGVKFSCL